MSLFCLSENVEQDVPTAMYQRPDGNNSPNHLTSAAQIDCGWGRCWCVWEGVFETDGLEFTLQQPQKQAKHTFGKDGGAPEKAEPQRAEDTPLKRKTTVESLPISPLKEVKLQGFIL